MARFLHITTTPHTTRPWRVWRTLNGIRTLSGDFESKAEAERAIRQLRRLSRASDFQIEFIGKYQSEFK